MVNYASLLTSAKFNPYTADFRKLRMEYASSSEYNPYPKDKTTYILLEEALAVDNLDNARRAVVRLIEEYYLDIDAHTTAAYIYDRLGDRIKSDFHRKFAEGLIDSIIQTGDGQSFQTAYEVIDVREEYAVLRSLQVKPVKQTHVEHEGHYFDIFDIQTLQEGTTAKIYFNVDIPRKWLRDKMAKE